MLSFIGVVHKEKNTDFGVCFPDFPGCITTGETMDLAKDMAKEALDFHIRGMQEDGDEIPDPSKLEDIMAQDDFSDAIAFLVIPVDVQRKKAVRINITVPEEILAQIDAAAREKGYSRSSLMTQAARKAIQKGLI